MRRVLLSLMLLAFPHVAIAGVERGLAAYERGDYATAVREFRAEALKGQMDGQFNLALMLEQGLGLQKNDEDAVRWYRRAAQQGHFMAQVNLGRMYANGQGVERNDAEAARWFRRAANRGDREAQNNLAVMFESGRGVVQSDEEAARWYLRAAEQGNAAAQNSIGYSYEKGRGIPKNDTEAVRWYQRGADQGHPDAQNNLAGAYARGLSVPKNFVLAYKWASLAAAQGDKLAIQNLIKLERLMTRAQIDEAQQLATAFHPRKEEPGIYPPSSSRAETSAAPQPSSSASTVRRIQTHLTKLGYDPGPIDGVAGPGTIRAIRVFQRDAGIEPDGVASGTLEALLSTKVNAR